MEIESMREKIIRGMCRVCLCTDRALLNMFSVSSELEGTIADGVAKCTSVHVKVEKHIRLPTTICESCYTQLIQAHKFQRQALQSDKTLQLYLKQLEDDDKQTSLGRSNSCPETNITKQTKADKSTDIKPSKSDCKKFEKVFAVDSKSKSDTYNSSGDCGTKISNDSVSTHANTKVQTKVSSGNKMTSSYWCEICNTYFSHSSKLSAHRSKHFADKMYQCNVCTSSFSKSRFLRIHKQTVHTGALPYQCDRCDKWFSNSSNLKIHQRGESTGRRALFRFKCNVCTAKFDTLDHLEIHKMMHDGKTYKCLVCNNTFYQLSSLKIHHRDKPSHA